MSIIDAAIDRTRTTIATLFLILIAGAYAYIAIPKEADPDINIPIIYVSMGHEGISPEDGERLLLRPMEQELRSIEGIKEMRSSAFEGGANVVLEFDAGFDADAALTDVREKVDRAKSELPQETKEPSVNEVNLSLFPVIVVTLSGEIPERSLVAIARNLRDEIEGIPSVLDAELSGEREELVEIIINPLLLESYGLRADDVLGLIQRSNLLVAAGALDTGEGRFAVKVPGLFETARDLLDQPLKTDGDSVVTIKDVAEVRRTFKDRTSYARLDGRQSIGIEVSKRTGENIIQTIEAVKYVVGEAQKQWDLPVEVTYSQDRSTDIRNMLSDLQNNVISAVILVMIVVVGALGLRSAGLVGVAIPGSFLLGILVLYAMGLTMNIVVLFALILAVGMLVDGAIVMTEFADRKTAEGHPRQKAFALSAKRMAWPIIASTATTLAAFMPLLFWPGIAGEFMRFLPITLIATLSASLLMALVFVPVLGARIGRRGSPEEAEAARKISGETEDADPMSATGLTGAYVRLLNLALGHPMKVLMLAVSILIGVQVAYSTYGRGVEFFPDIEPDIALINVHARGNLSVDEQRRLTVEVEERVLAMDGIKSVYSSIGDLGQGGQDRAEDVIAVIQMEFDDWETRKPAKQILADIMRETEDLAGIIVEPREQEHGPQQGKPIDIQISSLDLDKLDEAVRIVRARFEETPGLVTIEDTRAIPGIEWKLNVDRAEAAKYGVDIATIGSYVQMVTKGMIVSEFRPDDADDEIDIVLRFPDRYRTLEQLDHLRITTPAGEVPISTFTDREPVAQVGTIKRTDQRRTMAVKADVAPGVLADDKVKELRAWLTTQADLPEGVSWSFKGEQADQRESEEFLMKAFVVALFIMAIILVTQFNSFYSAFLILTAVIMSTTGVMIGLLVLDKPFGIIMSGVGVIALAGIVVNNNIILIDTFDGLKKKVPDLRRALLMTGAQRLRPVLLTTVTTILGLMPMVLQVNIDFITREVSVGAPSTQWWVQLATAVVFGLAFSTVLTLVVTPSLLMLRGNVSGWWARVKPGGPKRGRGGPVPTPAE
ncbi:MAG: efflux RND transporter permease subunit [Alphaproteobacteria bacterium]|nr:efflux RND transporter permease subunit [Alphaproteobacteria bacterium]